MTNSLLPEQRYALELMRSGQNVFLSGKPGTGKSHVLATFYEMMEMGNQRSIAFLAPTGMAAMVLPKASTIHSFFEFPIDRVFVNPYDVPESPYLSKKLTGVSTIVIDEISMVRADIFQAMDFSMRKHTGNYFQPFGGRQVIVVGDFNQLPPVIDDDNVGEYIGYHYHGAYAFCAPVWQELAFQNVFLKQVIRQNDGAYIEFLDALRTMKPGLWDMLGDGRFRINSEPYVDNAIALCCRNADADAINAIELSKISGTSQYSYGNRWGDFPDVDLPTDMVLQLKPAMRIMVVQNQRMSGLALLSGRYLNGETGTVLGIDSDLGVVTIRRDRDQRTISVDAAAWDNYRYNLRYDEERKPILEAEVVGGFRQLPLKPAWAMSIHKAQGQTLDRVHLQLGYGCFAPGQLYTALTRVRGFDGLTLDRPLKYQDVIVDPLVMDFNRRTFPEI